MGAGNEFGRNSRQRATYLFCHDVTSFLCDFKLLLAMALSPFGALLTRVVFLMVVVLSGRAGVDDVMLADLMVNVKSLLSLTSHTSAYSFPQTTNHCLILGQDILRSIAVDTN